MTYHIHFTQIREIRTVSHQLRIKRGGGDITPGKRKS
jgi:hypothetical protein